MERTMLKSKIHRVTVTDANLEYEGSITVDPVLMNEADILPYEKVDIYNCTNGERLHTYAIEGEAGRGQIVVNGAAAHKVKPGDCIIIASYVNVASDRASGHRPRLVYVDRANRVTSVKRSDPH
ncbi:MAG: aspartate 1-decarboxylase [Vicinamibacteria bacterium]